MSKKDIAYLSDQLREIESFIEFHETINVNVSKVSVAWHLDHMLKVINGITMALHKSDPKNFKIDFNISRSIIFTTGIIPRGTGKAPKSVLHPEHISHEDLLKQIEESKKNLLAIDALDKNHHFRHAVFGTLNRDKAKKFIVIHTNHHLKIIRDILRR